MMSEKSRVCSNRAKAKCVLGWAAFDLDQRRKKHQILESNNDSEAYPLLSVSAIAPRSSLFNKNEALLEKPYASVVVASPNYPSLVGPTDRNSQPQLPVCYSWLGTTAQTTENGDVHIEDYQKLKILHPWADESLIQDVFTGVNNNVDEALSLLEAMFVSGEKDAKSEKVELSGNHNASFDTQGGSVGEEIEPTQPSFTIDDSFNKESKDDLASVQFFGGRKSLSIEPEVEWVEDDLYLIHRKDAIRMIRSASRHSKSANDAHLRGDHASAFQFSFKAQEEWKAAEKLNAKAAKEILNIRNCKNDLWTLDLHGLHAAEAVEALSERLQTVEFLVSPNRLAAPGGVNKKSSMFHPASTTWVNMEKIERQVPPIVNKKNLLQVITGKGNHSRGGAALPSAIRNFLSENGYHFDETRSGAIMIRPKFRQQ